MKFFIFFIFIIEIHHEGLQYNYIVWDTVTYIIYSSIT